MSFLMTLCKLRFDLDFDLNLRLNFATLPQKKKQQCPATVYNNAGP
jgi:hypothetical protein